MSDFGALEVACRPLVRKFAGSNPAEAVGFFGRKNPRHAFLRRGSKAICPMSCFTACKRPQKWRGSRHFRQNSLGHFLPIVPPSAAGFTSVASDAGGLLWRKLERSKIPCSPPSWAFDVPLATAFCKTFLLRIFNYRWTGRNPTKCCSAVWRRRYSEWNTKFYKLHLFLYSGAKCYRPLMSSFSLRWANSIHRTLARIRNLQLRIKILTSILVTEKWTYI
jgi:hypothetical protein